VPGGIPRRSLLILLVAAPRLETESTAQATSSASHAETRKVEPVFSPAFLLNFT
jgi:hypothetical protein